MPSLSLRDYQEEALAEVKVAWDSGLDKAVLQLPTGGGKTEIAVALVKDILNRNPNQDILVMVHRADLVIQFCNRLNLYGVPAVVGSGNSSSWRAGQRERPSGVVVMGVQTLKNRLKSNKEAANGAILIVDEMHWYPDEEGGKSSWGGVIAGHKGKVLGLSATPWRMGLEEKFSPTWQTLIQGPQTADLIDQGFLADYLIQDVGLVVKGQHLTGKMRIASAQDTVDTTATWEYYEPRGTLTHEAVGIWYARAAARQTIVFALTTDHALALETLFNSFAGLPGLEGLPKVAACILGTTPEAEREKTLKAFEEQKLRVLIGVDVMREGFDAPEASCLLVLRLTESMALWRQMCGRVLRPKADGGKALILDLVGNYKRLGFPDDNYAWSLGKRGDLDGAGGSPYKVCHNVNPSPNCDTIAAIAQHFCKGCGAPFGKECPTNKDGCGEWRPWSAWRGSYSAYKADTCDYCGEKARQFNVALIRADREKEAAQAKAERDKAQKEAEIRAKVEWYRNHLIEERQKQRLSFVATSHFQDNPDAWAWQASKRGNGEKVDFARCRVWAGKRYGAFTWAVFGNQDTNKDTEVRLEKVNKRAGTFNSLEEAKEDIEELFEMFGEENQAYLKGILCPCLKEYHTEEVIPSCQSPADGEPLPTDEEIEARVADYEAELREGELPEIIEDEPSWNMVPHPDSTWGKTRGVVMGAPWLAEDSRYARTM